MCTNVSLRRESVNPAEVNRMSRAECRRSRNVECPGTAGGQRYKSPMRLNISSIVA